MRFLNDIYYFTGAPWLQGHKKNLFKVQNKRELQNDIKMEIEGRTKIKAAPKHRLFAYGKQSNF